MKSDWTQISQYLQQKLESGTYKVWIAPLKAFSGPGVLRLVAPNRFVANWVSERLAPVIASAAEEVLGRPVSLRIEASSEKEPSRTSRAPLPAPASASAPPAAPCAEQLGFSLRMPSSIPRWRYDFSSFIVGPCNDMAFAAAQNVAREAASVNTLFVSSGPGLGKTHLTQAVGAALCSACNHSSPRVEYLTAENFASSFVQAAKAHDFAHFKWRFHEADVLLLEDVHFLQGTEKIQTELLSAIKSLQERGKRVVLTSSFSPRELSNVDSGLVSRFSSGFLVGIEKPDFVTRRRILFNKAAQQKASLSNEVADLLAERLSGDVRQLESCLHSLLLRAQLQNSAASLDMALEILGQYAETSPFINLDSITARVCDAFGLSAAQLCARSRKSAYVQARNTVFYLARKHTDLSLEAIGEHFSRRHSTVLKGIAAVERDLSRETAVGRQLATTIERIERRCR